MKKSHLRVTSAIQKAIAACGDDFALEETKRLLRSAHAASVRIGTKRQKRDSIAEKFREQALKKHDEWWKNIVDGAVNRAKKQLEQGSQNFGNDLQSS